MSYQVQYIAYGILIEFYKPTHLGYKHYTLIDSCINFLTEYVKCT